MFGPVTPSVDEVLEELLKRTNDMGRRRDTYSHREVYLEPAVEISGESSSGEDQEQEHAPRECDPSCYAGVRQSLFARLIRTTRMERFVATNCR